MNLIFSRVAGTVALVSLAASPVLAQNELDALRYSQTQPSGTSRTQAMGGAGAALGADLGAFVLNPANVAGFRKSEFSISPGLLISSSNSSTRGFAGSEPADRNGLNFANFGVVIAARRPDDDPGDWRSGNFAINFSRINTFSANRTFEQRRKANGNAIIPDSGSVVEFFANQPFTQQELANNANVQQINTFADLGYQGYLLNFTPNSNSLYTPTVRGTVTQREVTEMRGAQNQIDIGYGASYRDKLYLGASLGIVTLRYKQTRTLTETNDSVTSDLKYVSLADGYEVNGGGINLRIGMVYKPFDALRLGLAVQTPTWFGELKEQDQQITLQTKFNRLFPGIPNQSSVTETSNSIAANTYQYALTTPFRATGGVTLIGGKVGLIVADVDFVNYSSARLNTINNDPGDFGPTNKIIRSVYRSTVNYRVGGEVRLANIFRLRAGYGFYGSPYVDSNLKGERTVISGGAGLRFEKGYVDFGISRTQYEQPYSPYSLPTGQEPVVDTKYTMWNPTVTIGFTVQ